MNDPQTSARRAHGKSHWKNNSSGVSDLFYGSATSSGGNQNHQGPLVKNSSVQSSNTHVKKRDVFHASPDNPMREMAPRSCALEMSESTHTHPSAQMQKVPTDGSASPISRTRLQQQQSSHWDVYRHISSNDPVCSPSEIRSSDGKWQMRQPLMRKKRVSNKVVGSGACNTNLVGSNSVPGSTQRNLEGSSPDGPRGQNGKKIYNELRNLDHLNYLFPVGREAPTSEAIGSSSPMRHDSDATLSGEHRRIYQRQLAENTFAKLVETRGFPPPRMCTAAAYSDALSVSCGGDGGPQSKGGRRHNPVAAAASPPIVDRYWARWLQKNRIATEGGTSLPTDATTTLRESTEKRIAQAVQVRHPWATDSHDSHTSQFGRSETALHGMGASPIYVHGSAQEGTHARPLVVTNRPGRMHPSRTEQRRPDSGVLPLTWQSPDHVSLRNNRGDTTHRVPISKTLRTSADSFLSFAYNQKSSNNENGKPSAAAMRMQTSRAFRRSQTTNIGW